MRACTFKSESVFSDYQQILAKISFVIFDSEKSKINRMWFRVALVFLIKNAEIVACIFYHSENRATSQIWKYGFFPRFGVKKWRRSEHVHAS